jgi:hypothetical protein
MPYKTRSAIGKILLLCWFLTAILVASKESLYCGFAYSQEDWRKEFDEICSKTENAMAFSVEELRSLVDRCDALKSRIEKLDEPQRKVTLRRLQMCRDLYAFVFEMKEKK